MKILEDYNDYMLDIILESIKNDETSLVISEKLLGYLIAIEHPIAFRLVNENINKSTENLKVTLLDLIDKNDKDGNLIPDVISFAQSNKVIEQIAKFLNIEIKKDVEINDYDYNRIVDKLFYNHDDLLISKSRSETTLGKVVNKLYPNIYKPSGKPGEDIESFVNMFKALRTGVPNFDLVKGKDINYWYNESNYGEPEDTGSIWGSCMRYESCEDYIDFYSSSPNKISLLILKDPLNEDKIIGRSIIWKIDKLDGNDVEDRYFMDRIYYTFDYIVDIFKAYAKEQGWLYKSKQNMEDYEDIIDSVGGSIYKTVLVEDINDTEEGSYPYADTLKYFDRNNGEISNDSDCFDDYITLTDTDGGAEGLGEWNDFYERHIDTEDMCWCERGEDWRFDYDCFYSSFYEETIANDYADDNGEYCDNYDEYSDRWREYGDYVEVGGETATNDWATDNWYYSDYSDEWCIDANYSEYHQGYINADESVQVYIDETGNETDYREIDDNTFFKWEHDGEYYDNGVSEDDLKEYHDLNEDEED